MTLQNRETGNLIGSDKVGGTAVKQKDRPKAVSMQSK
jgi:hypothetical protein